MQSPATAWEGALRRLQAETPEFAFQAWILPLDARLRDNHLELRAPSPFHLERVRSRHLDEILAAVREEDRELQVTLQLAEKAPARPDGEPDRKPAKRPTSADSAIRVTPARVTATPSPGPSAPSLQAELAFPDSFSTFVVGEANALAREASLALAVGRQPGVSPLYLMGPTGTGKSHLARALVAEARRSGCERPVYVSCEGFTTELMRSIRSQQTEGFRRRFRS
jgi:chromosomal replication initiator protein